MGNIVSKKDLINPEISRIDPSKDFDLNDKDVRKQLVDMAVEQFASLLWQRCLIERKIVGEKGKIYGITRVWVSPDNYTSPGIS